MTIDYEKLRKHINRVYDNPDYYPTTEFFKKRLIRNLATFLFDEHERKYLKKNLPADIYLKVLEAFCDGEHDT